MAMRNAQLNTAFESPRTADSRYASLDGLRGVASLIVVGYHAHLVVPAVSAIYVDKVAPDAFTPEWWLYATPLRLLFAGHEAVLVFFVLSGFVLTLPLLVRASTARSTVAYYGRRVVRLYLPVWGALLFALTLALAVPRDPSVGGWLGSHLPPTVHDVRQDAVLLFGTSNLDSPLWSLTWEVWFSLLLPLIFVLIRVTRAQRWWWATIPVLIGLSTLARFDGVRASLPSSWLTADMLEYLPVFGIGMLLAFQKERIRAAASRIRVWWPIVAGALLLTVSPTLVAPPGWGPRQAGGYVLSLVGVTVIVALAFIGPLRRPLEARPVQWAGRRSFSIYLVHEPIIVATALVVGVSGWRPWIAVAILLVPVVLVIAHWFYDAVERPSIGLSRRVGRLITSALPERNRHAEAGEQHLNSADDDEGPEVSTSGPSPVFPLPDLDSNQEPAG
ncbi:acyltransferase family protein [Leifsonia sp. NPDC056824]|uniref:acyltransferase family protein n=1 Tax=Leifsonia sp. NPDC056824 TaxID=3345953 RepID=UPI0036BD9242